MGELPGRTAYDARKLALIGELNGILLEIGAGDGANFDKLPAGIRWVGLEPRRNNLRALPGQAPDRATLGGVAERIPLRDGSVDGVLATAVLCAVGDQGRVLAEIRRVLRPGGVFVFAEHVAARGLPARAVQGAWGRLTSRFFEGCRTGRRTWESLDKAGFGSVTYDWYELAGRGLYNPYILGRATAEN